MSHKTIYIDIDEEITSIIDRIRKAVANEVIIVVPKQALLIQSLVNLKLLKKECVRRKKKVMIVTQDRIGKKLIEKAGIQVQAKPDNLDAEDESERFAAPREPRGFFKEQEEILREEDEEEKAIGSASFFEGSPPAPAGALLPEDLAADAQGKIQQKEKTAPVRAKKPFSRSKVREEKVKMSDIVMAEVSPPLQAQEAPPARAAEIHGGKKKKAAKVTGRKVSVQSEASQSPNFASRESQRQQNIKAEDFFQSSFSSKASFHAKEEKILRTARVKGKAGKYFFLFLISFVVLVGLAGAYYFLPSANVTVELAGRQKSISQLIDASTDLTGLDAGQAKIPAVREESVKENSEEFDATGENAQGGGKAGGSVVIYNEYSPEDQPLVATTRLETTDGKIFRITKNTVVPGTSQVGNEKKPGAVEVAVAADRQGEEYNIGPSDFKITGFKGGPKFDKFYAKSAKAMAGGGGTGATTVSAENLAQAKEKMIEEAKAQALEEWKNKFGQERRFFDSTVKTELLSSSFSEKAGAQTAKFSCNVKVKVSTLSFSEGDVKSVIEGKSGGNGDAVRLNAGENINYLLAESDWDKGTLRFETKADASAVSDVDLENFKKGILGKKSGQIEEMIKSYPAITKVDVTFWPFFADRVPLNEKRVKIEIKEEK